MASDEPESVFPGVLLGAQAVWVAVVMSATAEEQTFNDRSDLRIDSLV